MRLIDAEALKEIIKERRTNIEKDHGIEVGFAIGMLIACETIIDKQPTIEAKPNWIPVQDHLPKINEVVLVQDLFENIFVGKVYDPEKHNGKFGSYFINIQDHCVQTGVAWMPKPTPYKAKEVKIGDTL